MSRGLVIVLGLVWLAGCAAPTQWSQKGGATTEQRQKLAMSYFVKAKIFERQRNYYGAIVALRSAVDLDPTSATMYERLAWNYNRIHDYQMAILFAREALAIDPSRPELHYLVFQLLQIDGDQKGAIRALEQMLDVRPDHWRLYFQLAQLYKVTGKTGRIEAVFNRALQRRDAPVEVKINIADIFAGVGRSEQAEGIYRQALAEDPRAEDAWLGLGNLYKARSDTSGAIAVFRQAARVLPKRPMIFREMARLIDEDDDLLEILAEEEVEFLYELGSSLSDLEKFDRATRVFKHIVGQSPETAEEWLDLARFYLSIDDYQQVDEVLSRATEVMPDSARVYLFWGLTKERQGKLDQAAAIYRLGLAATPNDSGLWLYIGLLEEQLELWDEAIGSYRQGLAADPGDPDLHMRLGIVLGRQEHWVEATEHYSRTAEMDLLSSRVLFHWGKALEKLGRWPEAIEKLRQAAAMDQADTHLLFYLGSCYEQASRLGGHDEYFTNAIETFERLLEIDPDDAFALNYLGYMFADTGIRLQQALQLIQRAVELKPDNGAFFDSMGWIYFRLGDYQKAEIYLGKALSILESEQDAGEEYPAEEMAIIHDHAGDIARAMGKSGEARDHWRQVLKLTPENDVVRDKLQSPRTLP